MPSTLLDNLVDAWYFNEQPGQFRMGAGGNVLAEQNGVTRVAGKLGFAAGFSASASQRLSAVSRDSLSMSANAGWWVWGWVKFASLPADGTRMGLIVKRDDIVGSEWALSVYNNGGTYNLLVEITDPSNATVNAGAAHALDTSTWHFFEGWYDPVAHTVNAAWDGGAPAVTTQTTGTRTVNATLFLGSYSNNTGFLNGALNMPSIRKQAPTPAERAEVWNAGAGNHHPFGPTTTGSYSATLDNAGGAAPVPGGRPLPLFLPPAFFDSATLYYPNGDDLSATDALGNPLAVWPEAVDQGNRYGRVWVETPAAGVAAGGSALITLHYGDPARFATGDYDTLFAKRTVDANTVALYHLDTFAGVTTPEASSGTAMALVGTPTQQPVDGGNFRTRVPRQSFASGKHVTLNGTSQYLSVAGLLDTPPAAGCVRLWAKLDTDAPDNSRLFSKVNALSGTTVTEGLEVEYQAGGRIIARLTKAGVPYEATFETFGAAGFPHPAGGWADILVSWGTKLSLVIWGQLHAQAAVGGAWGANTGTGTPFTVGARVLASAGNFAPVSVDEIEVRNAEPTRAEYLGWYNRTGLPQTYEYDRWTASTSNPVIDNPSHTAGEPRLVRMGANNYVGVYGGAAVGARLHLVTSTDGKTMVYDDSVIMGGGAGGWAGDAARGSLFRDTDGTLYLYFSDAIGTTGGSIHYATTVDGGLTWTHQGVVIGPDAAHGGWANTSVVKVGSTYYWMIDDSTSGGGTYSMVHLRSSSPVGPLTLIDDYLVPKTLQVGTGHLGVGRLLYIGGRFHFFNFGSKSSNLSSVIFHSVSDDCQRWEQRGGGEAVVELDFQVLPRQDQAADTYVYAIPESGEVGLLHDVVDNHGGGGVAAVCLATFTGTLADLSVEYPQLVLGSPVVPPAPPTPTFTSTPADPSPVGGDVDFAFTSAGATSFECRIDGGAYATCTSPQSYTGLAAGAHTFAVRAVNAGGTSSPASFSWTVSAPPLAPGTAVLGAGVGLRRGGRP